jgi:hypothetical protein
MIFAVIAVAAGILPPAVMGWRMVGGSVAPSASLAALSATPLLRAAGGPGGAVSWSAAQCRLTAGGDEGRGEAC